MSMSIVALYSAESWSISTALCVLSGNDEIGSFSAIVWSCCCWAPGHGDCPVASSKPSDLRQRRHDDRKCKASNVVQSRDVEWLTWRGTGITAEAKLRATKSLRAWCMPCWPQQHSNVQKAHRCTKWRTLIDPDRTRGQPGYEAKNTKNTTEKDT